ncbi:hypothetical protein QQF45_18070 [Halopseudomonas aestusnigri]|uniref:hypothetical protein n=1 Tax=Halopseudomonas aestusnigri TaxID=857252 RepID=UPI002555765C|nr:hypothetical protein [Halopseudomonas aestusnigri]MDL2200949.1 hypothetical protein [Halopseudomonas aestusnigri]
MNITEAQFERAIYSFWDFQQALSALTFLLEDCDFDAKYSKVELRRFRCYESTLIISMARPFETTRKGTTIGLRALGITLSRDQKALVDKVLELRRKIVAHSAEEKMHFRVSTFSINDMGVNFPHFQFNEGLHFDEKELRELECFLRVVRSQMGTFFYKVAQEQPDMLARYKEPSSLSGSD